MAAKPISGRIRSTRQVTKNPTRIASPCLLGPILTKRLDAPAKRTRSKRGFWDRISPDEISRISNQHAGEHVNNTVNEEAKTPIQVIDRMMHLIDALTAAPEPATLKSLAAATGLHPSTAHRILNVMVQCGFADRLEHGTYRLGMRFLELGNVVRSRINVRDIALPH